MPTLKMKYARVWASIGHGEEEWTVVCKFKVLIGKLFAINGATTGTL
jgi:hypothetical protein